MIKKIQIVDLDNCISDDGWRIPKINWELEGDEKWDEYHANCDNDEPRNLEHLDRNLPIVIFTARPMKFLMKTMFWLYESAGLNGRIFDMFMRPDNDHRPSVELKMAFLNDLMTKYVISKDNILTAFDDREDVLTMYRSQGIRANRLKIHDLCAYTDPAKLKKPTAADWSNILNGSVRPPSVVLTGCKRPDNCASAAGELCAGCDCEIVSESHRESHITTDIVLREMTQTYLERSSIYGENYKMVGQLTKTLFPEGVSAEILSKDAFHLMILKLVKLTRFATSGLTHLDSIHDDAIYSAMIESILRNEENKNG